MNIDSHPLAPPANDASAPLRSAAIGDRPATNAVDRLAWALVLVGILIQWGMFRQYALREIVWAYPQNFDQLAFLEDSYRSYEAILNQGLVRGLEGAVGLRQGVVPLNAGGGTLHVQAALLYLIAGPSRMSALSLNFIYFALLQLALVATVRWLTGRWSIALVALGLLLTAVTGFCFAGGMFDFRLDFMAFCLFGIFICLVIRSGLFADWRWAIAAGVGGVALSTLRFITAGYLLGVYGLLLAYLAIQWFHRWNDFTRQQTVLKQLRGLTLSGSFIALFTGVMLYGHRKAIRAYYWANHVVGDEKNVRASEYGHKALLGMLAVYPQELLHAHLGLMFELIAALIGLAGLAALGFRLRCAESTAKAPAPPIDLSAAFAFAAFCFLVPLALLTADPIKSSQVAGIMVGPLVWLAVLALAALAGAWRGRVLTPLIERGLVALATIAILAGAWTQFTLHVRRGGLSASRPDFEKIVRMYDRMAETCRQANWKAPEIARDCNADYLYQKNLTVLAYERHDLWLPAGSSLGALEPYSMHDLYARLGRSDFAIITHPTSAAEPTLYPFDAQMQRLHPQVLAWCEKNLLPMEHFHAFDRDIDVFVRPPVEMEADADGWITSRGMDVIVGSAAARRFHVVEMRGTAHFQYLGRVPKASAYVERGDEPGSPVQAGLTANGDDYVLTLNIDPKEVPAQGTMRIHVNFDAHFVPLELGTNQDPRELVMPLPKEARLRR